MPKSGTASTTIRGNCQCSKSILHNSTFRLLAAVELMVICTLHCIIKLFFTHQKGTSGQGTRLQVHPLIAAE